MINSKGVGRRQVLAGAGIAGIAATAAACSPAATGLTEAAFAPQLSLLNRFGRPEEVAEATAWLCSDAATYVTGHSLAVEAGYLTR